MHEIAATFQSAGLPPEFHQAAEEIFRRLENFKGREEPQPEGCTRYTTKMSKRISIEVPGLEHVNPIPNASRVGPFLASGGIFGKDPGTGKVREGVEAQCEQMFANVRKVLEAGGAAPEDIIKLNVWLKDMANRPVVNKYWLQMFPDPHSRPARHTFRHARSARAIAGGVRDHGGYSGHKNETREFPRRRQGPHRDFARWRSADRALRPAQPSWSSSKQARRFANPARRFRSTMSFGIRRYAVHPRSAVWR